MTLNAGSLAAGINMVLCWQYCVLQSELKAAESNSVGPAVCGHIGLVNKLKYVCYVCMLVRF